MGTYSIQKKTIVNLIKAVLKRIWKLYFNNYFLEIHRKNFCIPLNIDNARHLFVLKTFLQPFIIFPSLIIVR